MIRHSMTVLLPMSLHTSIIPLSHCAFIPTSKIRCTFKKCHYFNFLSLWQNCEKQLLALLCQFVHLSI